MRKFFPKQYPDDCLMIAVSYLMKIKFKNIFFEIISNSKNFIIKLCSMIFSNYKDFAKLTAELDKGGLRNVEYGNSSNLSDMIVFTKKLTENIY